MLNHNIFLIELCKELTVAYKKLKALGNEKINWTDSRCKDYALEIQEAIKPFFREEQIKSIEFKLSESTTQRIMTGTLLLKDKLHWSTLRMLNNYCLFLGYKSWHHFMVEKNKSITLDFDYNTPEEIIELRRIHKKTMPIVTAFYYEAKQVEFDAYKALPEINLEKLEKYYSSYCSDEFERIIKKLERRKANGQTIGNINNPSSFSIESIKICGERLLLSSSMELILLTNEHWYLRWFNVNTGMYDDYSSVMSEQDVFTIREKRKKARNEFGLRIFDIKHYPLYEKDQKRLTEALE
jgi:hypothetical protein